MVLMCSVQLMVAEPLMWNFPSLFASSSDLNHYLSLQSRWSTLLLFWLYWASRQHHWYMEYTLLNLCPKHWCFGLNYPCYTPPALWPVIYSVIHNFVQGTLVFLCNFATREFRLFLDVPKRIFDTVTHIPSRQIVAGKLLLDKHCIQWR